MAWISVCWYNERSVLWPSEHLKEQRWHLSMYCCVYCDSLHLIRYSGYKNVLLITCSVNSSAWSNKELWTSKAVGNDISIHCVKSWQNAVTEFGTVMCSLRTAGGCDKMIRTFEGCQFVTVFCNKGRTAPWSHKHLHSLSASRLIYKNMAVLRLWRPVADLWPRRPGFNSRPVHVGLVKDKVAMGQIFVKKTSFFPYQSRWVDVS
jgi:hypothetical protein